MSADAKLAHWAPVADLQRIEVPTLVIGARYDTMEQGIINVRHRRCVCAAARFGAPAG